MYECGVCKKVCKQIRANPLYQCAVCSLYLCPDCDYSGLCHTHYKVLKPADQDMLVKFAEEDETIRNRSYGVLWIIRLLAGLAVGLLLSFILIAVEPYPHLDYSLLIWGCIILAGSLVVLYFRSRLATQREVIKITVDGIVMKYPELAAIMEEGPRMPDQEEPSSQDEEP